MFWPRLVLAYSLWEKAIESHPDPLAKNDSLSYFVVEIENPYEVAQSLGCTVENAFPIRNHWLLSHPHHLTRRSEEAHQHGAKQVYESTASRLRRRAPIPVKNVAEEFHIPDPLFKDQWFIHNPIEEGHDMNILPVWRRNITGNGITVAIVDDGLDHKHPDFSESFSLEGSWDYNRHVNLPEPLLVDDSHGTRCAGEIAAGRNSVCGVGIAPGAKVAGIRILSGKLTTDDEARALIHRYNVNDIYSCSWGPTDDGMTVEGPPPLVRRAELEGIENGRHGLGSIYVVASGNGAAKFDNCNFDGYTNSIYSITISAVDRRNSHPYYSESCSANLVSTYSSNYVDKITTSDRLDPARPLVAKCTNQHSGTSAAAPIAAAVFALVLEQRPDLTWRDLQYLARDTAKKFDIQRAHMSDHSVLDWQITADGHHYHNSYGYGLLDADAIVSRSTTWELVKPQTWFFLPKQETPFPITPTSFATFTVTDDDWHAANMDHIEHVRVRISYQHEERGRPVFRLISPAGIVSELAAPRPRDLVSSPVTDWEFMSVVHWNETAAGTWRLEVFGPNGMHGIVKDWQLKFFGQARDVSKVRRFSEVWNEYENPVSLVKDALYSSDIASSESPLSTSSTAIVDVSTNTGLFSSTASSEGQSSSNRASATTTKPVSTSASAVPSSTSGPDQEKPKTRSRSWGFGIFAVAAVALLCGGFILAIMKLAKRKNQKDYIDVNDQEFELEQYDDSYEIDDDDLNNNETAER